MDSYEATRVVFTRIQSIDPEYASKIMGLLLIQDQGEKEMIRLAFGPESLLHSVILKARKQLAISTRSVWTKVEDHRLNSYHAAGAHHHLSLDLVSPNGPHRRSSSVNDVCLYFARGYCKNGGSCRFTHGEAATVGSFDMMEHCQQHLLMAGSPKSINFLLQQQSDSPRMIGGDDMNKFGRMGSRQIYLTFPADSTFREEDVSNYFSIYGPVQDVRIPYQHKRMFGFVTFVYAETVNLILAKGNPHFVCDARVLVKPYKEKGKVPEKFRKPLEGFDSAREPFDLNLDLLWRKKLEEQADLQHAIELQNRRIMDLQLLDVKRSHHHQRALSTGAAIPSPTCYSPSYLNHPSVFGSRSSSTPDSEDGLISKMASVTISGDDPLGANLDLEKDKETLELKDEISDGKSIPNNEQDIDLPESLEHNLPDNLFASPKASGNYQTVFSNDDITRVSSTLISTSNSNLMTSPLLPATSTLDLASLKSCYFQFPRFSTGHGCWVSVVISQRFKIKTRF